MTIQQLKPFDVTNYNVQYTDYNHTYKNIITGKKLYSVTQILGKYKRPFDINYWASVKASQRGITKQEQLDEWNYSKNLGASTGTIIHNIVDFAIKQQIFPLEDTSNQEWSNEVNSRLDNLVPQINQFFEDFKFNEVNIPLAQESILSDNESLYAGKLDYFGYNTKTNKFVILDYKSDKEFTTESKYKYLKPLSHLQDSKKTKYSLQVTMYQHCIMQKLNLKPEQIERYIIWFNENNESYTVIPVDFMEKELHIILEDLKQKQLNDIV